MKKEDRFKQEQCTQGDKHDVKYREYSPNYQEIYCSKCGKSKVISK